MLTTVGRAAYVRMLSAVYASMFLIRLAFGVVIVTFAGYVPGASDFLYSLVATASPFAELITVIFAGLLIDKYGRKGVLLTGLGLGAFALYGLALTQNIFLLALLQAIHGVAAAFILVTTLAVIATYAPPDQRGRAMGIFNLVNIVGWIGGFVLGSLFQDWFAGRLEYTFVIAGALATIGLVYANRAIRLPSEARTVARDHRATVRELVRAVGNPRILVLTAPWLIVFILVASFITFFPRVTEDLALSGGSVALATLVVGGLMLASQYFWGRLADRHGRESIMLVGAFGMAALMGVIVYAYFATGSTDGRLIFENVMSHGLLLSVCLFVALAFAPAGLAALADEAQEGAQGTTMSAYSLTLSLGFIVGPPILGAVSDRFGGTGMVIFFAILAATLLALVLSRFVQARRERAGAA